MKNLSLSKLHLQETTNISHHNTRCMNHYTLKGKCGVRDIRFSICDLIAVKPRNAMPPICDIVALHTYQPAEPLAARDHDWLMRQYRSNTTELYRVASTPVIVIASLYFFPTCLTTEDTVEMI